MKTATKLVLLFFVLAFAVLISFSDPLYQAPAPRAQHGEADLSSWNFSGEGNVSLNGEWECYDGRLLQPEDFHRSAGQLPQPSGYVNLTSGGLQELLHQKIAPKGVRTYRLRIRVNPAVRSMGLLVDNVKMSSRVYINGDLYGSNGVPAEKAREYVPKDSAYTVYFANPGPDLEIILQTANYDSPNRGLMYTLVLGEQKSIELRRSITVGTELCGAIVSLLIGLYYFILFSSFEDQRKEQLFAVVEFFSFAVFFLFSGQKLIYAFFPSISFELLARISQYSLLFVFLSIVFYTNLLAKTICPDWLAKLILGISGAYFLWALLTPFSVYTYGTALFYLLICAVFLLILCRLFLIQKTYRLDLDLKNQVWLYFICLLSLLVSLANGFLYDFSLIGSKTVGSIAICIFILISQLFLAYRFSANYARLAAANRVKNEFILKTSYALKSPLNSIVNLSKSTILKNSGSDCDPRANVASAALTRNITQRMLDMIDSIWDVTLLQNDQFQLNITPVDLKVCAELAAESVEKYAGSKNIRIKTEFAVPLIAEADENRVRQILFALVLNAVESMESGVVLVRGARKGKLVCVTVEDSGCGIPAESREKIFEPYVTLRSDGIGLGLYLTRQFAERMGGTVRLLWSEPNRGSRFELRLPVSNERARMKNTGDRSSRPFLPYFLPDRPSLKSDGRQVGTVLVADDNVNQVQAASDILNRAGYRVLIASSGPEALKQIESEQVDLAILDVMMPEHSGISVCRMIREKRSMIELPVLLSQDWNSQNDFEIGLEAGANDFIDKPFLENVLLARVSMLIALKDSMEDAVKSELAFLQAQIKPHFLYNTINTIISFCYTGPEKAAELLTDLSKYLRMTFDIDQKRMLVPLKEELEIVRAYMEIAEARFSGKIRVEYEIAPELMNMELPPLCIQPLVENAQRHGLRKKTGGGIITVSVRQEGKEVEIAVRDNGVGMSSERLEQLRGGESREYGVGLWNVRKRIEKWRNSSFEISSKEGTGTTVTILTHQNRKEMEQTDESHPD